MSTAAGQQTRPAFGVGCAKSGTHSLARMFQNSMRAQHEPADEQLLELVLRRYGDDLPEDDFALSVAALFRRLDLDLNVSQINGFIIRTLIGLYPRSRYILTIRDCESWMRSFVNHQRTRTMAPNSAWWRFRDLRFEPNKHPHGRMDTPLRASGLYGLDAYLSYWLRHNADVIVSVPSEQLYIVPTGQLAREAPSLSKFLGLPSGAVSGQTHEYAGDYVASPVDELDRSYLCSRLDWYTSQLLAAVRGHLTSEQMGLLEEALTAASLPTDIRRWSNAANLHDTWARRSVLAARFVPQGATLLDLGCGKMAVEKYLPPGCRYVPVDVVARDARTVVCDFNKKEYPPLDGVTHISVLGVLEYVHDPQAFWRWLAKSGKPLIVSYIAAVPSFPPNRRRAMGWVNDLTREQFLAMTGTTGHVLTHEERVSADSTLFVFVPPAR
jgi:hypothetical protein